MILQNNIGFPESTDSITIMLKETQGVNKMHMYYTWNTCLIHVNMRYAWKENKIRSKFYLLFFYVKNVKLNLSERFRGKRSSWC